MSGNHFIERASWTLVDQCVVSGGNFLLMVLLARSLSEEDYGEFALFLGAIFLLRTIDYSFISYPLSVRLCVANDDERARLLGNTVVLTVALSLVLVMLMALGTTLLERDNILLPACLCYLCWQAQETSRRFLLADFRYREAVHGDGVAYVGQVLLIAVLLWIDTITLSSSLYVMSATLPLALWCMRRRCDLPGRTSPKCGEWPLNIFRSGSGPFSTINWSSFACSSFRGYSRPSRALPQLHRFRPD